MGYPNDSKQSGLYNAEGYDNTFEISPGVCILPLAEDPPTDPTELQSWSPVVILRLHAPYRIRKVTHLSDKKNNPPPLPSYADQGAFVFVGGNISIVNKLNTTFRNFDWTIACEYTFVENCVCREVDGYVLGSPTFTWSMVTENISAGFGLSLLGDAISPSSGQLVGAAGAITFAGIEALTGYTQGQNIVGNQVTGALKTIWGYNTPTYYPGTLVYSEMINSGPPILTVPLITGQ